MFETYRSGLIWRLMRRCEPLVRGLRRAGFASGWLWDKCQTGLSGSSRQNGGPSRSDPPTAGWGAALVSRVHHSIDEPLRKTYITTRIETELTKEK